MQYILTGFTHELGFRVFAFESVEKDRSRIEYKVKVDLALIQRHRIRVQELPLLCRGLLERSNDQELRALTYTEAEMSGYEGVCSARDSAAKNKRRFRKSPGEEVESAGLAPQV